LIQINARPVTKCAGGRAKRVGGAVPESFSVAKLHRKWPILAIYGARDGEVYAAENIDLAIDSRP